MRINKPNLGGFANTGNPPPNWVATPCVPKATNGCPRCPFGKTTPCTNTRHQCTKCDGLGITHKYERCLH